MQFLNPLQTAALGICFWVLSLAQVIVMAWMWKYNDPEKHTSDPHKDEADPWQTFLKKWLLTHRISIWISQNIYWRKPVHNATNCRRLRITEVIRKKGGGVLLPE